jgi:hypothetical protein
MNKMISRGHRLAPIRARWILPYRRNLPINIDVPMTRQFVLVEPCCSIIGQTATKKHPSDHTSTMLPIIVVCKLFFFDHMQQWQTRANPEVASELRAIFFRAYDSLVATEGSGSQIE